MSEILETLPVTVNGASDDLIELENDDKSIYEEYCIDDPVDGGIVGIESPNGEQITLKLIFGAGGWEISVHSNEYDWEFEKSHRKDEGWEDDPALIIHAPVGSTCFAVNGVQ